MLLLSRNTYRTLAELSEPELRLGGLRVNPRTNISSGESYRNNIRFKGLYDSEETQVEGLPENPRLTHFSWSPDETKVAFTHTTDQGVELWYFDFSDARAHRLTEACLNANLGLPYS